MAYTLGSLRTYVRDLTGVYSTDLVPDTLLTSWINEAYFDVARQQEWPWLPVSALVNSGDAPAFADEYRPLLAYRVAAKVLAVQADDTNRGQVYIGEYQSILDAMYQDDLQAAATNTMTSQAGVVRYVRDLLGIYDDTVTDTVITNLLGEVYTDLYKSYTWPFSESPVPYATAGIGRALAYGTAARLSVRYGRPPEMSAAFGTEYESAVALLQQTQLTDNATVTFATRANLAAFVRTLLNEYSKRIPTSLINAWLSEEYVMLASSQDWPWLQTQFQTTVFAGTNLVSLPSGSKKVLEVFFVKLVNSSDTVTDAVNESEIVYSVPSVLDGSAGNPYFRYSIDYNGVITLTPAPESDIVLRVRYVQGVTGLGSDAAEPAFDPKFRSLLSYRVAARVLDYLGVSKPVRDTYVSVAQAIFDDLYSEYMLDHSTEPLQLGGRGLETRKYLPWFRTP